MLRITLLGAGLLGTAIGQRLIEQGVEISVWNRSPQRIQKLLNSGARLLNDLDGAAANSDAVITVLRDGPVTDPQICWTSRSPISDSRD